MLKVSEVLTTVVEALIAETAEAKAAAADKLKAQIEEIEKFEAEEDAPDKTSQVPKSE